MRKHRPHHFWRARAALAGSGLAISLLAQAASAQTPPPPSTFQTADGFTMVSACQADGKFASLSLTPAFRSGSDDPRAWFRSVIKSHVGGWATGMAPEPVITTDRGVLVSKVGFAARDGAWRAWFYAVARGDRMQWAVALAPPGMPENDPRLLDFRNDAMQLYTGTYLLAPEGYAAPAAPPARPTGSRDDVVARLKSTALKYAVRNGPNAQSREYALMRDGYVLEIEPALREYVSVGRWSKQGANYKIIWGSQATEVVSGLCLARTAATPATSAARPGCRMVPKTITTFTTRSFCDALGRNCTTQSVPQQSTVMQEQCD